MKESESNEDNKSNEVEEKLLHQFYFLKEEQNTIKIFGEYNFDESEEIILEIWQKIIKYLLEDILCRMEISITDLKRYTKIKNKEPLGLKNILIRLRYNKKYITLNDLNNEKFYEMNFPDLYPKEQSQSSSLFSFLPFSNWCRGEETNQNKNKNDNNKIAEEENSCRKDISAVGEGGVPGVGERLELADEAGVGDVARAEDRVDPVRLEPGERLLDGLGGALAPADVHVAHHAEDQVGASPLPDDEPGRCRRRKRAADEASS